MSAVLEYVDLIALALFWLGLLVGERVWPFDRLLNRKDLTERVR